MITITRMVQFIDTDTGKIDREMYGGTCTYLDAEEEHHYSQPKKSKNPERRRRRSSVHSGLYDYEYIDNDRPGLLVREIVTDAFEFEEGEVF